MMAFARCIRVLFRCRSVLGSNGLSGIAALNAVGAGMLVIAADTQRAQELIESGFNAYQRGDYHSAAEQFQQASLTSTDDDDENNAIIWFDRAGAEFKLFRYREALDAYSRALDFVSSDIQLESEIRYNLGVVKHTQAITAMMTFQDAITPLRTALTHYRDSLALDPNRDDTRYNLELAHQLLLELAQQRVQQQSNPQARNQKTSENQGQLSDQADQSAQSRDDPQQAQADPDAPPGAQGENVPVSAQASTAHNLSQSESGASNRELSAAQANQLIELSQQRAQANDAQRQQWRQARMRNTQEEKFW